MNANLHPLINETDRLSEKELVAQIKSGNSSSFKKLFDIYSNHLLNFARQYLNNPQVAEDIVQEVFVRIWENRGRLDPTLSIKAYLFTAVRNLAFKHIRDSNMKQGKHDYLKNEAILAESPEDQFQVKELTALVYQVLEQLPYQCRQIFSLNRFENLSYKEIADMLDISVNTVKTQMGRAFKSLRKQLSALLQMISF